MLRLRNVSRRTVGVDWQVRCSGSQAPRALTMQCGELGVGPDLAPGLTCSFHGSVLDQIDSCPPRDRRCNQDGSAGKGSCLGIWRF